MEQDRKEIQQFLRRACHDLRNHLRSVRANSELLLRNTELRSGPEFDHVLGFLVSGAAGAGAVIDAISSYASALEIRPNPAPVSSGMLLRSAIARLSKEIAACQAEVTYGEMPAVEGDPDRLIQLFENLLRNALDHCGDAPPRIQVNAVARDGEWLFSVRDNGPGIDAEDLDRIFRPFETLGRQRPGLGLAICREIVTGHGGRLWAESAPGAGATFYFTLK